MINNDTIEIIKSKITAAFGEAIVAVEQHYDFPVFVVKKDNLHGILSLMKQDADLGFHFLTTMCTIHFPENKGQEFCMMYQLHNMPNNWRVRFRTFMAETDIDVPTVTDIWPTANWMERQEYDFFGINFVGHPNLTRILNMDQMNYFPMRKEFALEDGSRTDKDDKYFGR